MRFRRNKYRPRITPRSRHNYYRRCRPSVLIMKVDARKAAYIKQPKPYRRNG